MRFRRRFSIRTLAIFVTLVCAYFGAWEATKRYGVAKSHTVHMDYDMYGKPNPFKLQVVSASSPFPLVIRRDETLPDLSATTVRHFYLWFFGAEIQLPFTEWAVD